MKNKLENLINLSSFLELKSIVDNFSSRISKKYKLIEKIRYYPDVKVNFEIHYEKNDNYELELKLRFVDYNYENKKNKNNDIITTLSMGESIPNIHILNDLSIQRYKLGNVLDFSTFDYTNEDGYFILRNPTFLINSNSIILTNHEGIKSTFDEDFESLNVDFNDRYLNNIFNKNESEFL